MESNTHLTINRKICVYKSIVPSIDFDDFVVCRRTRYYKRKHKHNIQLYRFRFGGNFRRRSLWIVWVLCKMSNFKYVEIVCCLRSLICTKKTILNAPILVSTVPEIEFKSIFLWIIPEIFILAQKHWNYVHD